MVAKKMASAEPTFTDLTESAGNTVTLMKEVVGAPVIKALIPVMKDMVARLKASRGAIERYAKTMGKDIARWVKEAATRIQAGFKYLKTHGDEIRESITKAASAIKSAFVYAKKVVDFIIENKEGIAAAFIASKGIGMAGQVASAAGGGMAGAKAGGAFGLAVVAFGFAVQQFAEAQKEGVFTSKAMKDLVAKQESIKRKEAEILGAYKGGKIQSKAAVGLAPRQGKYSKAVDQARASMVATAAAAGENARVAGQMFDNAEALRKKTRAMLIPVEQAVTNFKAIDRAAKKFPDHIMSSDDFKVMNEAIGRVSASFKAAKEAQHIGAMQQIATLLMSSQQAQKAFLASATLTKEGFALLASFVTDEASGFKADLESLAGKKPSKMSKDKAPSAPMNFNINNAKFEIKQDFRDQDPDRVAVVFQRDLKRAAVNRVQSRRASVFGF
jgi:hypothetical protein